MKAPECWNNFRSLFRISLGFDLLSRPERVCPPLTAFWSFQAEIRYAFYSFYLENGTECFQGATARVPVQYTV